MFTSLTEKQEGIIKISLELISEKGVKGLTIKNIAQKNGTVESAIYRHFKGKNEILHAIVDAMHKNSLPENYSEKVDTILQIENTLTNHFETFAGFPAIVSVLFSESLFQSDHALADRIHKMTQKGLVKMTTIIQNGQDKGEVRKDIEAQHLTMMVSGTFRMYLMRWKMADYNFNLVENGKEVINSIKKILNPCD